MKELLKDFEEKFGYKPDSYELISLYRQGELTLTDRQEDDILMLIDVMNLN